MNGLRNNKNKGVETDMKFKITFACEEPLQEKKLKRSIDDYHDLTPGTTKQIHDKHSDDDSDDEGACIL